MAGFRFPLIPDEKYKASVYFQAVGGSSAGIAILYFPEAVSFNDGIVYDNVNLGIAGEIARKTTAGISTIGEDIMKSGIQSAAAATTAQVGEMATGALDTLGNIDNIKNFLANNTGTAASLAVQAFTPDAISAGVAAGSGVTANPHKRSVFRDVAIRNFTFSFLMSPSSPEEGQVIEDIVDFFRENAYPERIAGGFGYKFPTKFKISFRYSGAEMTQAPKILDSYLTSVNTTLNPRSSSFFKDGKANETQISLQFVEETALHKEKIKEGY